jgi:hypothetical protein
MLKVLMISAFALIASGPVFGQDIAAVDPTGPVTDIPGVVKNCELVAGAVDDTSFKGICIGATQKYLDGLVGQDPAAIDQNITDLVLALAPLAQNDEACNALDDEVAQAIRLASTRASTPDQVARLVEIADTIAACDAGTTAAIGDLPPGGDPASPA